jgi:nitrite reductase/ring-hydroxylating ferredoxin subunit
MAWHEVAKVADVPEGEAIAVSVNGEPVALYNLGGAIYATHDRCTHAKASLAEGYIEDDCVECPLHEAVFHIPTGRAISGPVSVPVRIYPVRIDAGMVSIDDQAVG